MSSVFSEVSEKKWHSINAKKNEVQAANAVKALRSYNIEPILIKGIAAAQNYPPEHPRVYVDIDLAVSPHSYSESLHVVSSDTVLDPRRIDLHNGLRHLDTTPFETLFERSRLIDVEGTPIRILSDEDHLRVLVVHWLNDGGEFRERLYDIYYAVANRSADFDWGVCLDSVSKTRRKWIIYTIGLANRYLDLGIDDLAFADEARSLPRWLIDRIEYEWEFGTRIVPLKAVANDRAKLFQQLKKRLFSNPIQAMVEMEADLDARSRYRYQITSLAKRTSIMLRGSKNKNNAE